MRRKVTLTIWDDLPIPAKIRSLPVKKHPLHPMLEQLEVGECFDWPRDLKATPVQLQAIIRRHERSVDKKFKFRTVMPKPWSKQKINYRIWRIK
jgi:hypothetical protein